MNNTTRFSRWGMIWVVIGLLMMNGVAYAATAPVPTSVQNEIQDQCNAASVNYVHWYTAFAPWCNSFFVGLAGNAMAIINQQNQTACLTDWGKTNGWGSFPPTHYCDNYSGGSTIVGSKIGLNGHAGISIYLQDPNGKISVLTYCSNYHTTVQQGTTCTSTPNSCGMTGAGFQVTGYGYTCSALKPSDSLCTATSTTCATGQHQDPSSNQCVSNCAAGQHWDTTQNKCVNTNCAVGQHWDTSVNACVIDSCFVGYHWDATQNKCVASAQSANACPIGYIGTPPTCTLAASCPIGYTGTPPNCTPSACVSQNICSGSDVVDSCTGTPIQHCSVACQGGACTIPAPQVVNWHVSPILVKAGKTSNATWDVRYATSCTVTDTRGDTWTGLSDTKTSSPLVAQTIFTLNCTPLPGAPAGHVTRTTTVNIAPTFEEQ